MRTDAAIPVRGRAFNVKGFRPGLKVETVLSVFHTLMPGCLIDAWNERTGNMRLVARVYVSRDIESVYPEFSLCAEKPGIDVPIEIGPFELAIWMRPKLKAPRSQVKKIRPRRRRLSRVQLASCNVVGQDVSPVKPLLGSQRKRHPDPSPPHKRTRKRKVKICTQKTMEMEDDFVSRMAEAQEKAELDLLSAIRQMRPSRPPERHVDDFGDTYFNSPG